MKLAHYCILFFLCMLISCGKKNNSPYYGSASMIVNGVYWQTNQVQCVVLKDFPCYKNKIAIGLLKYSPEGFLRETYSFVKVAPQVLNQKIYPDNPANICNDTLTSTFITSLDDGDVAGDLYNADSSSINYLNIENYNSATGEVSGSFEVTYIFVNKDSFSLRRDTIRITNGKFSTKIQN